LSRKSMERLMGSGVRLKGVKQEMRKRGIKKREEA